MRDIKLFDRHVLTLVLALSLAACGGSNAVDPLEAATPFGAASTASPAGARDVPADELRALVAGGTPVTWLQADAMDAAVAAEQAAQAADEATLAASTDPTIAALRARTLIVGDGVTLLPSGDRSFSVESPQGSEAVVIQGDAWRRRALAQSAGALASRDNAMALYRQYRDALPEGVLADLPPADDLASLTDAAVQALVDLAAQRAVDVLSNESALPPDDAASASGSGSRRLAQGLSHRLQAPLASGCTHADDYSLYSDFDFALKNSLSAIRSQGKRGTCVAFATVAGLETQIRKAYGHSVDLSEQQLYAKAKGDWSPTANAFGDGLVAETVLPSLIASGLALRAEAAWAYNAAHSRTEIGVAPGFYQKSCDGYGEACSDTNHEYGVACTTIGTVKYCARLDPTAVTGGESYRLLAWGNLWRAAPPLTTLAIRASLAAGQPVAIGIDVDECLKYSSIWSKQDDGSWEQRPGRAYLNTQQYSCGSRGTNGTHEMLAVGYVSDAQMAARWSELPFHVASDEGGYFVVRNSWGCGAGDGGYVYISDYYLRTILLSASSIGPVLANYGSVSLQYTSSVPTGTDGIIRSPATVTLKANANSLVKRVAFYRQGPLVMTKLAEIQGNGTLTHAVSIDAGSNGNRVYFARGWDADGNLVSSNTVVVRVRIPGAPTVSLSASPTPAVAGQTLTLSAAAASSDGSAITQVQFMRGFTALATVTSPPFTTAVTLARGDTGNVGFVAVATNGNGYSTTSAPLIVTVKSGAKPKIDAFTVSPAVIGAPQVVTLAWTVSGADTLTLTGNPGNTLDVTGKSSQQLSQTQAATFTLTASNAAGSTSATVSVAYVPLPSIASFTATPSTTAAGGGTVSLAWSASDATTLSIDHGVGDVTGLATKSIAVTASTTYTLTASNASGATMRQVTVTVPATPPAPPAIGAFSATPATLAYPGGASTLAWTVSDATAIAIDHGVGSVTGSTSVPVNVTATTTYTLSASNAAGTSTAQVTVAVGAPPPPPPPQQPPTIASFTATPDSLPVGGGSTTLAWSTNGADTVAIDHGVGTVTGTSRSVSVATTTTYVLTASNGAGNVTAQVTVNVAGSALDRYADAVNGNDANDGSAAAPFRTIGKALAQTPSGATAWLFNGSYTRVAEGLAGISRLTVPDGRTLAAMNSGAATIGFGLTMAASGHLNGVVIDNGGLNDSAIIATSGTVGLSRIAVRNSGRCDPAIIVRGSADVTLDSGGDAAHSYAGAAVHGFAGVSGGTLRIVGGRIEGAGQLLCTGRGVLTAQSQGHLRLDGVTIVDADFLTHSGGGVNAVIAGSDSATVTLVGTVIDGATVPGGEDSVGIDLRSGVATSALSMSTSTISRMAGRGAAIAAGAGTVDVATSTFTGDGYGITDGSSTLRLTVTDTLFNANRYGGIELTRGTVVVIDRSTFTDNWKTPGPVNSEPTAAAIALWDGGHYTFTLRNSTIQGNGNTSVARPAILLHGDAGSTFNLGDGANPGGNVLADNANVNLWVNTSSTAPVKAVGNRWTASAQGADASGHYVVPSGLCGTTPCDLTSGAGTNFKVLFGTLRLVE